MYFNILEPKSIDKNEITTSIDFDKYIAEQILLDHINNPKNGLVLLPYKSEFENKKLWPSPKLRIKCYYSDIQKRHYCSEIDLFFHGYRDINNGIYKLSLLNMFDMNFAKVKKISKFRRNEDLIKVRKKRYISFFGVEYPPGEALTLVAK